MLARAGNLPAEGRRRPGPLSPLLCQGGATLASRPWGALRPPAMRPAGRVLCVRDLGASKSEAAWPCLAQFRLPLVPQNPALDQRAPTDISPHFPGRRPGDWHIDTATDVADLCAPSGSGLRDPISARCPLCSSYRPDKYYASDNGARARRPQGAVAGTRLQRAAGIPPGTHQDPTPAAAAACLCSPSARTVTAGSSPSDL